MNVEIIKVSEKNNSVCYKFKASIPVGTYVTEKGASRTKLEEVYGYCCFDKLTEKFELDEQKTHPYFFKE